MSSSCNIRYYYLERIHRCVSYLLYNRVFPHCLKTEKPFLRLRTSQNTRWQGGRERIHCNWVSQVRECLRNSLTRSLLCNNINDDLFFWILTATTHHHCALVKTQAESEFYSQFVEICFIHHAFILFSQFSAIFKNVVQSIDRPLLHRCCCSWNPIQY